MQYSIYLVEDHPVVREALESLIGYEEDFNVVGSAETGQEAYEALRETPVDIVVTDLSLPAMNGIELTRALVALDPQVRVLIVSGHQDALYARAAKEAGARGFVSKGQVVSTLVPALYAVLNDSTSFVRV